MDVSVVVCTYAMARYDSFVEAVESVRSQTYDRTEAVLVVDGNEAVYERARRQFGDCEDVVVHCNDENRGVAASRTTGARLAGGDVVAFLDDDAVADDEWVERLVEAYRTHDAVAVGGRIDGEWLVERPWYLPTEFDWLVGVTYPGFADDGERVRNTFGSNLSMRRAVFLDLGGFNPNFGPSGDTHVQADEPELGMRLYESRGERMVYAADAVVAHKVFASRTDPRWLLRRAHDQGYSKRVLEELPYHDGGAEGDYLRSLVFHRGPGRLAEAVSQRSLRSFAAFLLFWVYTAAVGVGYLRGWLADTSGKRSTT